MKNPNGYGSVVKLSGNRRRPFHVRKTLGWNEKGHPIYQTLDYTRTREEGMLLLAQFNKDPWNVEKSNMTLESLFELWLERKAEKVGSRHIKPDEILLQALQNVSQIQIYRHQSIPHARDDRPLRTWLLHAEWHQGVLAAHGQICLRVGHCHAQLRCLAYIRYRHGNKP